MEKSQANLELRKEQLAQTRVVAPFPSKAESE
jgi:hypothetical protein